MKNQRFEEFRNGGEKAFRSYFEAFEHDVYHYILRCCEDPDLAQELTQKAFIKLYKNCKKINDERHLLNFLLQVVKNEFLKYLRGGKTARKAAIELSRIIEASSRADDPDIDIDEILRRLRGAVRKLAPQRRRVVEMYFFQGLKVPEIALELAIADQTVRNTLSDSIKFLRKELTRPI
jgi:RNA polymerase sigma factor (sigma-70 family)